MDPPPGKERLGSAQPARRRVVPPPLPTFTILLSLRFRVRRRYAHPPSTVLASLKTRTNIRLIIISASFCLAIATVAIAVPPSIDAPRHAETPESIQQIRVNCTRTLEDLRCLDSALDQLAIASKLLPGTAVLPTLLIPYIDGPLRNNLAAPGGPKDRFGNPYGPFIVGQFPFVHPKTAEATKTAIGENYKRFWVP